VEQSGGRLMFRVSRAARRDERYGHLTDACPGRATMTTTSNSQQGSSVSQVTEKQARQVAEAARETEWKKPSFAKELFLGRFDLDLVHPHPTGDPAMIQKGEEFLKKLRAF